jgi:hypothetical protein
MTYPYRIHSPEVWVQARDDYLAGLDAEAVCRRHDLGLSAFRRRARKYGWRRRDQDGSAPARLDLTIYDDLTIGEEVETARLRFVQALERGRPMEAVRWRRLWKEMQAELEALAALVMPDEEPPTFRFHLADEPLGDETENEEALLLVAPEPVQSPSHQPEVEPAPADPARVENVHDVHSIFSGVHISDAPRPSKRAARRRRAREGPRRSPS